MKKLIIQKPKQIKEDLLKDISGGNASKHRKKHTLTVNCQPGKVVY